jgi:hypothetical protein
MGLSRVTYDMYTHVPVCISHLCVIGLASAVLQSPRLSSGEVVVVKFKRCLSSFQVVGLRERCQEGGYIHGGIVLARRRVGLSSHPSLARKAEKHMS